MRNLAMDPQHRAPHRVRGWRHGAVRAMGNVGRAPGGVNVSIWRQGGRWGCGGAQSGIGTARPAAWSHRRAPCVSQCLLSCGRHMHRDRHRIPLLDLFQRHAPRSMPILHPGPVPAGRHLDTPGGGSRSRVQDRGSGFREQGPPSLATLRSQRTLMIFGKSRFEGHCARRPPMNTHDRRGWPRRSS